MTDKTNKLIEFLDELREFPDKSFSKGQMGIFWKVDPIAILKEIKEIMIAHPIMMMTLNCASIALDKAKEQQEDIEYGGLIDALQEFVDNHGELRVSQIRDHLLMAIQALKWKGANP